MNVYISNHITPAQAQINDVKSARENNVGVQNLFSFGGSEKETPYSFIKTQNDNFIIVGSTKSYGLGKEDVYVVKINPMGDLLWNTTIGWQEIDAGYSIIETSDGNYMITGTGRSFDGIGEDVLLLKINNNGKVIWKKEFGRNAWEWGKDLIETINNEILIVGSTQDFWGADYDYYVIKTDLNGNKMWSKYYDISGNNHANSVIQAKDDNYIVVGTTSDITNINKDILIMKLNQNGKILWSKTYGGSGKEEGHDIANTIDGYIVVGSTSSYGEGRYDVYVLKINENGDLIWNESYGTSKDDHGHYVLVNNNKISIVGTTYDTYGKSADIYYLKITNTGELEYTVSYGTNNYDEGVSVIEKGTDIWLLGEVGKKKGDFGLYEISLKRNHLHVQSSYGEIYGDGYYYENSFASFSLQNEVCF